MASGNASASSSEKRPVRVTILNQQYTLLAGADARDVEELAHSVDELLHSIAAKASTADSTRVAVLACLHLADRLHTLERDLTSLKERVDQKTEEFAGLLESALEG
jgi:cell division protein ZapA